MTAGAVTSEGATAGVTGPAAGVTGPAAGVTGPAAGVTGPAAGVTVQYVSDLHLELNDRNPVEIPKVAEVLVLAGDIGDPWSDEYAAFLETQAGRFRAVLVVLGNHEYYCDGTRQGTAPEATLRQARAVGARLANVHVLEKDSVAIGGVEFLGTTLWSDMEPHASVFASDLRHVPGWSWAANQAEHARCVSWLRARLADLADAKGPVVVVTHHAPTHSGTSAPHHSGSELQSMFATDLDDLVHPPVSAWIHGHTHWSHTTWSRGVLVASNAAGLREEDTRFDGARTIRVIA